MKKTILFISILLLATSCTSKSIHKSTLSAPISVTADTTELEANVTVGDRISGTASERVLFGFISMKKYKNIDGYVDGVGFKKKMRKLKSAAAYDAITKSGADIIVNPQYTYTITKKFFGIVRDTKCTVTGFKGIIDNIETKSTERLQNN